MYMRICGLVVTGYHQDSHTLDLIAKLSIDP
jgi:hypothetical protein